MTYMTFTPTTLAVINNEKDLQQNNVQDLWS